MPLGRRLSGLVWERLTGAATKKSSQGGFCARLKQPAEWTKRAPRLGGERKSWVSGSAMEHCGVLAVQPLGAASNDAATCRPDSVAMTV
jgi:hypothetical protein